MKETVTLATFPVLKSHMANGYFTRQHKEHVHHHQGLFQNPRPFSHKLLSIDII